MATSWKPVILVISIGEKWMQDLCDDRRNFNGSLNELLKHAILIPVRTAADALKYLSKNFPEGILVTDPGLAQPGNKELLDAVVAFARASGTVVMSYCFSSHLRMDVMKDFWKNAWGLPWEPGSILRGSFALNTSASTLRGKVVLMHELYRQQALSLVNVEREHTWFLAMDNSNTDSVVLSPEHQNEAVVAFAPVGIGRVGYTGDLNMETGTHQAVMRMFEI
ncbi:hypothetical protein F5883DRAFT_672119 [Diaporthe sp. PMI_573]|nr:hypothetical protein F5883DRAFT_672119 [Diaporthaceae sp. PMI_573]